MDSSKNELDRLCINTIRMLSADAVEHPQSTAVVFVVQDGGVAGNHALIAPLPFPSIENILCCSESGQSSRDPGFMVEVIPVS